MNMHGVCDNPFEKILRKTTILFSTILNTPTTNSELYEKYSSYFVYL